jgi:hypothetical protein
MNRVVARFADGRIVKGMTSDFSPGKTTFHVTETAASPSGMKPVEIRTVDLKALFFVRDFAGNPRHAERNAFEPARPTPGRRLKVTFIDGEILVGTTQGYQPGRPGFFLVPADPESNIERCYVVTTATREVAIV